MDLIWLGALAALWGVAAAQVLGLGRLDAPGASNGEVRQ